MSFNLPEIPPLKASSKQESESISSRNSNFPSAAAAVAASSSNEPSSVAKENQSNAAASPFSFSPNVPFSASKQQHQPRRSLLRYHETMESFFHCDKDSSPEYWEWCRKITDVCSSQLSIKEEAKTWRRILEFRSQQVASEQQQQQRNGNNNNNNNSGADLLRMHRRATSRFNAFSNDKSSGTNGKAFQRDLFHIWLSFAHAQLKYGNAKDARQTLKYLQNEPFGATEAAVYLALAQVEGEDPESVLQLGIQKRAEPILDLHDALRAWRRRAATGTTSTASSREQRTLRSHSQEEPSSPKRRKTTMMDEVYQHDYEADDHNQNLKNTSQLSQDSNMSLDESEEEGGEQDDATVSTINKTSPAAAPKESVRFQLVPLQRSTGKPSSIASGMGQPTATNTTTITTKQRPVEDDCKKAVAPTVSSTSATDSDSKLQDQSDRKETERSTPSSAKKPSNNDSSLRRPGLQSSLSSTSLRLPTSSSSQLSHRKSSFGKSTSRSKLPPLQRFRTGLGKAERVDPSQHSILESDSDLDDDTDVKNRSSKKQSPVQQKSDDKKTPAKKITKSELAYIYAWKPSIPDSDTPATKTSSSLKTSASKRTADGLSKIDEASDKVTGASQSPSRALSHSKEHAASVASKKVDTSSQSTASHGSETSSKQRQKKRGRQHQSMDGTSSSEQNDLSAERARLSQKASIDFLPLVSEDNLLQVNNRSYLRLGVIGKGGSCKVYRALSSSNSVVAIKKVKLDGLEKRAIEGYSNEIALLKRLRGNPTIIQLHDSQVDLSRKAIYLVMEAGDSDLNAALQRQLSMTSGQSERLSMNFIRLTWEQMLRAVHSIHEERIIHGDLKPANFLFVRGTLKLIDFGIAKAIASDDTTNIYRESQIGTLNYMSPEAILDSSDPSHSGQRMKCGRVRGTLRSDMFLYLFVLLV